MLGSWSFRHDKSTYHRWGPFLPGVGQCLLLHVLDISLLRVRRARLVIFFWLRCGCLGSWGAALVLSRVELLRGRDLSAHVVTPPSMHHSSIILLICWHMLYSISFLLLPVEISSARLLCRPAPSSWAWPVSRHAQPACTTPPALHQSSIILLNRLHMLNSMWFLLLCMIIDVQASHLPAPCPVVRSD